MCNELPAFFVCSSSFSIKRCLLDLVFFCYYVEEGVHCSVESMWCVCVRGRHEEIILSKNDRSNFDLLE